MRLCFLKPSIEIRIPPDSCVLKRCYLPVVFASSSKSSLNLISGIREPLDYEVMPPSGLLSRTGNLRNDPLREYLWIELILLTGTQKLLGSSLGALYRGAQEGFARGIR